MTVKEMILAHPAVGDFSDLAESKFAERGVDGSATYDPADKGQQRAAMLALADVYLSMSVMPNWTEYKLSMTYNAAYLYKMAQMLYNRYGDEEALRAMSGVQVPRGKSNPTW